MLVFLKFSFCSSFVKVNQTGWKIIVNGIPIEDISLVQFCRSLGRSYVFFFCGLDDEDTNDDQEEIKLS